MTGYRTRWISPPEQPENPERITIREALAVGKAVHDQCRARPQRRRPGRARTRRPTRSNAPKKGGTEPTIALLRRLATALDADVHLTAGHDLGPVRFEPHAA